MGPSHGGYGDVVSLSLPPVVPGPPGDDPG